MTQQHAIISGERDESIGRERGGKRREDSKRRAERQRVRE